MTLIQAEAHPADQNPQNSTSSSSRFTNRSGWTPSPWISAQMEQEIQRLKKAIRGTEVPQPIKHPSIAGCTVGDVQGQTLDARQPDTESPVKTATLPVDYLWSLESKLSYSVSQIRLRQEESRSIIASKDEEISASKSQLAALAKSHTILQHAFRRHTADFYRFTADISAIEERIKGLESYASWAEQNADILQKLYQDTKAFKMNHANAFRTLESQFMDQQTPPINSKEEINPEREERGKVSDIECDSLSTGSVDDFEQLTWDPRIE